MPRISIQVPGIIKILDANVWLALAFSDHAHHIKALSWFTGQSDGSCAFCRITQLALLRHLKNSNIMGQYVQSQQEAWNVYDRLRSDPRAVFVEEPADLNSVFKGRTQSDSPSHRIWTDAFLASIAIMMEYRIVTFDKGFAQYIDLNLELLLGP